MMTQTIIADTSGLYAVVDAKDPNHYKSSAFLRSLAPDERFGARGGKLILSNHIFDELMTLTKARLNTAVALQLGLRLRTSQFVEMVMFSEAQEQLLWRIFHRYQDKAWSYTDCACFLLAQEYETPYAFSLDHHFRQMGLTLLPE